MVRFSLFGAWGYILAGHGALWPLAGEALAAAAPPPIEDPIVDLAIITAADEDRGAGRSDCLAVAEVDEGQGPGVVDRGAEID